ncbi:arsenic resistance protein [Alkalilimnicola ehrlichii MLHE-1]|uniref:Bile acid:sodium symporter n=1 Tax=Alkalilimnicola ehrlichii (strain ATCC BAA-1101 / DSM 17681 / MLHE-1) TaxID=187272 RepID=Q0AB06_ALKEH|nr:bile acid:sodium symporter [Alkalilimnicola ehrlichii]ABI55981.1 Bile acid:sodium symporter [Alkalilimnicola ehrlichii MLHE-1]
MNAFQILSKLTGKLTIAIPAMMAMGFVFGAVAPSDWLQALILPLTFLMVYPMMVNLKVRSVLEGVDGRAQGLALLVNFGVIPFIAFAIGLLFLADHPYFALGLLLAALLPTSGMTIAWTGFAKGNVPAAIKMTVIGLLVGSVATPFYVQWLMGAEVPVDLLTVFRQIAIIVLLPLVAGQITQHYLRRRYGQEGYQRRWAPRFPPLSSLGVLGIVFVAMALKAGDLIASPGDLLIIAVPVVLLYLINYTLSTGIARAVLGRGEGIALVYGTVMRNLSIALALAMNAFGEAGADAALVVALAFIIQVQSAAWYVKLTDRVFGSAPETDGVGEQAR